MMPPVSFMMPSCLNVRQASEMIIPEETAVCKRFSLSGHICGLSGMEKENPALRLKAEGRGECFRLKRRPISQLYRTMSGQRSETFLAPTIYMASENSVFSISM